MVSYLADNAITSAGGSVLGENVVTAEYKVNYLRPARGRRWVTTAVVESSASRLAMCRCEIVSFEGDESVPCAIGRETIAALR